jgi:hypothetical protein
MAKKKVPDHDPGPACSPTQEQHDAAMAHLQGVYEDHLNEFMAHLHNRFVAFIGESRLPLPQVLLVLEMLMAETIDQAKKKYLGE